MGELTSYFKQRYSKNASATDDIMRKIKVKNALILMCEELLKSGDVLLIEVLPRDLEYIPMVVGEEPLKSTVSVDQVAPNLFNISLLEVDI